MWQVQRRIFVDATSEHHTLVRHGADSIVGCCFSGSQILCRDTVVWRSQHLVGTSSSNQRLENSNWFVFQILKLNITVFKMITLCMDAASILFEFVLANVIVNILIEIWLFIDHSHLWVRILFGFWIDAAVFYHSIILLNCGPVKLSSLDRKQHFPSLINTKW